MLDNSLGVVPLQAGEFEVDNSEFFGSQANDDLGGGSAQPHILRRNVSLNSASSNPMIRAHKRRSDFGDSGRESETVREKLSILPLDIALPFILQIKFVTKLYIEGWLSKSSLLKASAFLALKFQLLKSLLIE